MRVIDYIYVIGSENGPCKVGITNSLTSRLRSIQTGSPHRLKLLYAHPCSDRDEAKAHEKMFHECHQECRLEGEWFNLDAELAIEGVEDCFQIDEWHRNKEIFERIQARRQVAQQ